MQYIFIMTILNMCIVLVSILSIGLLTPFIIFFSFFVINKLLYKKNYVVNKNIFKKSLQFSFICLFEMLIIFQYVKIFVYLSNSQLIIITTFVFSCYYFYIFNTYYIFLSLKNIDSKNAFILSLIGPFSNIKSLILLILTSFSTIFLMLRFPSFIFIIGITCTMSVNNIIMESSYASMRRGYEKKNKC